MSAREWIDRSVRHAEVRLLVAALFRVATYAADLERMSAGAAVRQVQMALKENVYYLDCGWQVLVNGLRDVA